MCIFLYKLYIYIYLFWFKMNGPNFKLYVDNIYKNRSLIADDSNITVIWF